MKSTDQPLNGSSDAERRAHAHLAQGVAASRLGDAATALGCFWAAAEELPSWGLPHFLIGSELAAAQRYPEAEAALARAVLQSPEMHIARYQLGLLQFSSNKPAVALVTWEPLRGLGDANPLACFVEGYAALACDDLSQAKALFQRGLAQELDNDALRSDVEKVLAVLEGLTSAGGSGELDARSQADRQGDQPLDHGTFLLGGYGRYVQ